MNTIFLLFNRIKQYATNNRLVFTLFIVGSILNTVVFAYMYGNFLPAVRNRESNNIEYRMYDAVLDEGKLESDQPIKELSDSGLFETIVKGFRTGPSTYYCVLEGTTPTTREIGSISTPEGNEVIIPYNESGKVGDIISLRGKNFVIKGRHSDFGYYISKEMFEKMGIGVNTVKVVSKRHYETKYDDAKELLEREITGSTVYYPLVTRFEANETKSELELIIANYLISAVAFMFLFEFLLETGRQENTISRIVGASKVSVSVLTFWEGIILVTVSAFAGLVLHYFLTPVLFKHINISQDLEYRISDYASIGLIIFGVSVFVILFFVRKNAKKTLIDLRRS